MLLHGIDVSNNNEQIDWRRVAAEGVRFAYVKATEGQTFDDSYFATNRAGATASRITVGAYHYAHPGFNTPDEEVEHLLAVAAPRRGELVPALDIEAPPKEKRDDWKADIDLPVPKRVRWVRRWLSLVENELGAKPVLYVNYGYWENELGRMDAGANPLWLAAWTTTPKIPSPWRRYSVWQHSARGEIDGVPTEYVDVNVADADALRSLVYGSDEVTALKNGDVIRASGRRQVYLLDRGRRRKVPDAATFLSKWHWGDVKIVPQKVVDALPEGPGFPALDDPIRNGDVVRAASGRTVYLVERGRRRAVPDAATFLARWNWYEVRVLDADAVDAVPLGEPLPSVAS